MKRTDNAGRLLAKAYGSPFATIAALQALAPQKRADGEVFLVAADNSLWRFAEAGVATDTSSTLIATPSSGIGVFARLPGEARLVLPVTFATADASVLFTVPVGTVLEFTDFSWSASVSFTGGASSAIGVSSPAKAGATTKGDLLGGAAGDVAATLAASANPILGTIGTQWGTIALRRKIWVAGDALRFDQITSAFTAGVGAVNAVCRLLQNNGS